MCHSKLYYCPFFTFPKKRSSKTQKKQVPANAFSSSKANVSSGRRENECTCTIHIMIPTFTAQRKNFIFDWAAFTLFILYHIKYLSNTAQTGTGRHETLKNLNLVNLRYESFVFESVELFFFYHSSTLS